MLIPGFIYDTSSTVKPPKKGTSLKLEGSTSGNMIFAVPSTITTHTIIFPSANASGVLTNDGSGNLSWGAGGGGGGGSPGGSGTEIQYRSGASTFGAVTGSSYSSNTIGLVSQSTTNTPLAITGAASQTGDLLRLSANGSSNPIASFGAAGQYQLYNAYTSSTNYELGKFVWASNVLIIGTEKGSGGGTARALDLRTDNTTRFLVSSTGICSINTSTAVATAGGLDIASGGLSLVLGADNSATGTRTNASNKNCRIACVHYTNAQAPVGIVVVTAASSTNDVLFGGGSSIVNAATGLHFYTAENNTTTTGTERVTIDSSGLLGINKTSSIGAMVHTVSSGITTPNFIATQAVSSTADYLTCYASDGVTKYLSLDASGNYIGAVGSGTNANAPFSTMSIVGPAGTGTGTGGDLLLRVCPAGSTGSSVNTAKTVLTLDKSGDFVYFDQQGTVTYPGIIMRPVTSVGIGAYISIRYNSTDIIGIGLERSLGSGSSTNGILFNSQSTGTVGIATAQGSSSSTYQKYIWSAYGNVTAITVASTGTPTAFTLTPAANTSLTASTEVPDIKYNLARTVTWSTGTLTTQRFFCIMAPTIAFNSSSTCDTAATFSIDNSPIAGTNATITNPYSVWVQSGMLRLDSTVVTTEIINNPSGTTQTINWRLSNKQTLNLSSASGTVTLTFTDPPLSSPLRLIIIQGGTARNLVFPANVKWDSIGAPTWTSDTNKTRIISLEFNGTNYYSTPSETFA